MTDMLSLTDADYWQNPTSTLDDVFERLIGEQLNGVVIGAPRGVSLDAHRTLPIVAYRAGSYFDIQSLRFSTHAILAAVDLERNIVRFANAIEPDGLRDYPIEDARALPEGYTVSPYVIDARDRLALSWRPGTYLFSIIMRDRVSNRVKVRLGKSSQGFHDEAVDEFIALYRRRVDPEPVQPAIGDPLPCYRRLPESPEIPAKNGVVFKIDRVLLLDSFTKWIVRGSFRLPVLPQEIVRSASDCTAIPRITLLAVGADSGNWTTVELRVPSYDPIDPKQPVVTGFFSFDLMKLAGRLAADPQTYFIYVFSGEILEGPIASALVPESWLRPDR